MEREGAAVTCDGRLLVNSDSKQAQPAHETLLYLGTC